MAKYIYAEYEYQREAPTIHILHDIRDLSGKALEVARGDINATYNHEGEPGWDDEWWTFDAFNLSPDDLADFCVANELLFTATGDMWHVDLCHAAEFEQDNLAGYILAEATARFGYSSDAAILEATSRWIAERIGYDKLPRHSGLIILEDGSTIHCSREHGGLFFTLPAPLEPTE
ncbi:MAG: hypothetical protein IKY97_03040 [Mailhella sp.]|nr:hypothetical protein [Mailhella sp.]